MRITRTIAVSLIGALLILGACGSPQPTTSKPAAPAAPAQTTQTPAPTQAPTTPVPTPAPAPVTAPANAPADDGMADAIPGAAGLEYTGFKITPSTVKLGETAKVTVNATNRGVMANFAVLLKVDGKVVDEQALTCKVDIDCDETKEATFYLKMASKGTYKVSVGDQTDTLVVQ